MNTRSRGVAHGVHKSSLLDVFNAKQRLEVPLFQRLYVWSEDQQWLPLWEDIERKFTEAPEDRKDAPDHFHGAMVWIDCVEKVSRKHRAGCLAQGPFVVTYLTEAMFRPNATADRFLSSSAKTRTFSIQSIKSRRRQGMPLSGR